MNWKALLRVEDQPGRSARAMSNKLRLNHLLNGLKWGATSGLGGFVAGSVVASSIETGVAAGMVMFSGVSWWLLNKSGEWQRWAQGAEAEERVGKMLNTLADEGWIVMHDRGIKGSKANIDHLLISPSGNFAVAVDTKAWHMKGAVVHWSRGALRYGQFNKTAAIGTAEWEADRAKQALKVEVVTVICLDGGSVDGVVVRGRRTFDGDRGVMDIDGSYVVEDNQVLDLIRSMLDDQPHDLKSVNRLVRRANSGLPRK